MLGCCSGTSLRSSVGKYEVSVSELRGGRERTAVLESYERTHRRCGMKGDSMLRIVVQSTPAKKVWFLISSAELRPSRDSCPTIILRAQLVSAIPGAPVEQKCAPPDKVLALAAEAYVLGEVELVLPVDDLAVGVVRVLAAEGRVPDEALEHDRTERPPIALLPVALLQEDLGRDVVGRADGRVRLSRAKSVPGPAQGR
mgnify:CR=1 FL=1